MIKIFHPRGVKELFWKAGRTTEQTAFKRLIKKYPTQAIKAHKLAQLKGIKKVQALGKRHGVEGLGAYTKGKKIKPSRYKPTHFDDPNKAYADLHQIKGRASAEAKERLHGWGFKPRNPRFYKVTERILTKPVYKTVKGKRVVSHHLGSQITRSRKTPQYIKHKNLSAWIKSGRKTYKD